MSFPEWGMQNTVANVSIHHDCACYFRHCRMTHDIILFQFKWLACWSDGQNTEPPDAEGSGFGWLENCSSNITDPEEGRRGREIQRGRRAGKQTSKPRGFACACAKRVTVLDALKEVENVWLSFPQAFS